MTYPHEQEHISLTDMVKGFEGGSALIEQWLKMIHQVLTAPERLKQLNAIAITWMRSLVGVGAVKQLGKATE